MTAIDWRCQECGWFWCTTENVSPDENMGDPPCDQCMAGSTMNAEPFCSVCGHPLEWGEDLCEHFTPEDLTFSANDDILEYPEEEKE